MIRRLPVADIALRAYSNYIFGTLAPVTVEPFPPLVSTIRLIYGHAFTPRSWFPGGVSLLQARFP